MCNDQGVNTKTVCFFCFLNPHNTQSLIMTDKTVFLSLPQ